MLKPRYVSESVSESGSALVYFSRAAIRMKVSSTDTGSLQWTDDRDGSWRGPAHQALSRCNQQNKQNNVLQTENMQLTRSPQNNADHSNCSLLQLCRNVIQGLQFRNMKNHHEHQHGPFQFLNGVKVLNPGTFQSHIILNLKKRENIIYGAPYKPFVPL